MQKFTVFSALLSLSIILIIGDVVSHDYLSEKKVNLPEEAAPETTLDSEVLEESEDAEVEDIEIDESAEETETPEEPEPIEEDVDLSSESTSLEVLVPHLSEALMLEAGFFDPTLKDTIYSGYVFQFLPFSDPSAFVYQWNLFDGETYIGSIYEIKYPNETASFQGYLSLRETGASRTDTGSVNEVNNYKDASFYYNHTTKTQTVHLVVRSGDTVYGFEYPHRNHETMKKLFELIP